MKRISSVEIRGPKIRLLAVILFASAVAMAVVSLQGVNLLIAVVVAALIVSSTGYFEAKGEALGERGRH